MNFGQIKDLTWVWLDDLNHGYFLEDQVERWVNNAQMEVQKQLIQAGQYWYLKCATTYTVADQDCYALPADFLKCNRMELRVQGTSAINEVWSTMIDGSLQEAAFLNFGESQPAVYTIGKDCFYLRPIPDAAYLMRLFYSYRVTDMTTDLNVPDVPLQYHEYLAILATIDGFLKDQRDPAPMLAKKEYYQAMMKQDATQRNRAQPRHVIQTQSGGWDMGF